MKDRRTGKDRRMNKQTGKSTTHTGQWGKRGKMRGNVREEVRPGMSYSQ